MQHNVILSGWGCCLRPVTIADSEFIIRVRSQDKAKGNIHAIGANIADQEEWIRNYYKRDKRRNLQSGAPP